MWAKNYRTFKILPFWYHRWYVSRLTTFLDSWRYILLLISDIRLIEMFSNALKSRVARLITISKNIKLLHTLRLLYSCTFPHCLHSGASCSLLKTSCRICACFFPQLFDIIFPIIVSNHNTCLVCRLSVGRSEKQTLFENLLTNIPLDST